MLLGRGRIFARHAVDVQALRQLLTAKVASQSEILDQQRTLSDLGTSRPMGTLLSL